MVSKKFFTVFFSMFFLCFLSMGSFASGDKTLATFGKTGRITTKDLEKIMERIPLEQREYFQTEAGREQILRDLVRKEVFAEEALSIGLDKDKEVKALIAELTKELLSQEYVKRILKSTVSEAEARKYFDDNRKEFKVPEKIVALAILFTIPKGASAEIITQTESIAEEFRECLLKGEDYKNLLKKYSGNHSIKIETDDFPRGRLVPELEQEVFKLKAGETSPILKANEYLRLFKVELRTPERQMIYEEAQNLIKGTLLEEKAKKDYETLTAKLFAKYGVVFVSSESPQNLTDDQPPSLSGKISDIIKVQGGGIKKIRSLVVEFKKNKKSDKIVIAITPDTEIWQEKDKGITAEKLDNLKIGLPVKIWLSGPLLQSYPMRSAAKKILILGE